MSNLLPKRSEGSKPREIKISCCPMFHTIFFASKTLKLHVFYCVELKRVWGKNKIFFEFYELYFPSWGYLWRGKNITKIVSKKPFTLNCFQLHVKVILLLFYVLWNYEVRYTRIFNMGFHMNCIFLFYILITCKKVLDLWQIWHLLF